MAEENAALLIVEQGVEEASVIPLHQRAQVIGKLPHADIFLGNPYVSRRHARILWKLGRFQIADLGSKNSTYINGAAKGTPRRSRLASKAGTVIGRASSDHHPPPEPPNRRRLQLQAQVWACLACVIGCHLTGPPGRL